jgi:hypothetical protein
VDTMESKLFQTTSGDTKKCKNSCSGQRGIPQAQYPKVCWSLDCVCECFDDIVGRLNASVVVVVVICWLLILKVQSKMFHLGYEAKKLANVRDGLYLPSPAVMPNTEAEYESLHVFK